MLDPVSSSGEQIRDLLIIVTVIGAVVLLLVAGAITVFAVRYRGRADGPEPPPIFGNSLLEGAWFVVPIVIVIVLFGLSVAVARDVETPSTDDSPDLIIIAHQWWWEVQYPKAGVVTANEIHIPAGTRQLVQLESIDVIHDFWVPAVGRKIDAIPGHPNRLWISADEPGTYLGACAEFCGMQHAWMRLRVIAQPQDEFNAWLLQQGQTIPTTTALATRGSQLFQERTCAACHAVDGRSSSPNVGPDLANLAARETLGAGVIENTPENLARWLKDPQTIKPGSLMPDLNLTDDEIAALVAYLEGSP